MPHKAFIFSKELPDQDVSVEKFLGRWPQIAKYFVDEETDQGTYKIMLGLQRTDKFCMLRVGLHCLK